MHVGMEEPIAKHLGEEDLDPFAGKARDVDAGRVAGGRVD
jgi:hypothetical protein